MNNTVTQPCSPAYLFVGSKQTIEQETVTFLQNHFCQQSGCNNCVTCQQIIEKQHYGTLWIEPEKRYTLDAIEIIFKRTALALDADQSCFFVVTRADFLNAACANSMLKLVEEPPPGYHFIFLAERPAQVLPTIRSRCTQKTFTQKGDDSQLPPLVQQFMRLDADPLAFSKEIASCSMTEQECVMYLDELLAYWIAVYKRTLQSDNLQQQTTAKAMVTVFKNALKHPPAPGSAKLFWKNLFLQQK